MANYTTSKGKWSLSPDKGTTIDSSDILDHVHQFGIQTSIIAVPDYSRRKLGYSSRKINGKASINVNIFQLHYPCYITQQWVKNNDFDSDLMIEMSENKSTAAMMYGSGQSHMLAAKTKDSTYQIYLNLGSQAQSFICPLGGINYYYHYCSGAGGSDDSGDNVANKSIYIIPLLNTPAGTKLVTWYSGVARRASVNYIAGTKIKSEYVYTIAEGESNLLGITYA